MNLLEITYFSKGGCSASADYKNLSKIAFLNVNNVESISEERELRELEMKKGSRVLSYKKGKPECKYHAVRMVSGTEYYITTEEAAGIIERFNLY